LQSHGLPPSVFSSLDLLPEEIFGAEEVPEYILSDSSSDLLSDFSEYIINCAAAFGI
jgi:hypothetical protein